MARFAVFAFVLVLLGFGVAAYLTLSDDGGSSPALRTGAGAGPAAGAVETISTGKEVDLAASAEASGMTIFDFTADW